jgi:hydrogenase small subunit
MFNETPDVWPIGIGAPCVGCTEKGIAFNVPIFQQASVHNITPPDTYPPVNLSQGRPANLATGAAGVIVGAGIGAAWAVAQRFKSSQEAAAEMPADFPKELKPGGGGPHEPPKGRGAGA